MKERNEDATNLAGYDKDSAERALDEVASLSLGAGVRELNIWERSLILHGFFETLVLVRWAFQPNKPGLGFDELQLILIWKFLKCDFKDLVIVVEIMTLTTGDNKAKARK